MDTIKFPIKFDSSGLQKLAEGFDDYYSQLLTIALLTEPQSHPFTPRFGVNDPAFSTIDKGLFVLNASRFVPEVEITSLNVNEDNDGSIGVSFSFAITGD
jgi:hypothetical protein